MNAGWMMLLMAMGWWWGRRKATKPTGPRWIIRDLHGCFLIVFEDHDGTHFLWTTDRNKATQTTGTAVLEQYREMLIRQQPENGPFMISQIKVEDN